MSAGVERALIVKRTHRTRRVPRHELDYRVKRGRLAVFRPSGNPRGKWKVSLEAVREAYPEVYESLLQRAAVLAL